MAGEGQGSRPDALDPLSARCANKISPQEALGAVILMSPGKNYG
jgi:hypothetical protein